MRRQGQGEQRAGGAGATLEGDLWARGMSGRIYKKHRTHAAVGHTAQRTRGCPCTQQRRTKDEQERTGEETNQTSRRRPCFHRSGSLALSTSPDTTAAAGAFCGVRRASVTAIVCTTTSLGGWRWLCFFEFRLVSGERPRDVRLRTQYMMHGRFTW